MAKKVNVSEKEPLDFLNSIRNAFWSRDWDEAIAAYERLGALTKVQTGIRVEAMSLAARAFAAKNDRRSARQVLRPLLNRDFPNPRLYGFVAAGLLEVNDYAAVAAVCQKAAALVAKKRVRENADAA